MKKRQKIPPTPLYPTPCSIWLFIFCKVTEYRIVNNDTEEKGWKREAAKKFFFLVARQLRGGRLGKGPVTKKKQTFFKALKKIPQKNVATKLEGGEGRP